MVKDLAKWVARLFALLDAAGENEAVLGDASSQADVRREHEGS